jgi:cellulose biosynthesis protein BcsQ
MPTIALVSRKGGCGKSTLATHIAAYFARAGLPITLGDLDHQQSMRVWLKRRPSAAPAITGWVGESNGSARPPLGVTHLVLDTPGGLHGLGLAKVAMVADAILIPVSASVFDREAASDCWAELRVHPRVVSGRCQVAAIGMRLDRRTAAEDVARDWAASIGLDWLGSLRASQLYVRAIENGLSIFDMPKSVTEIDREQWEPLLEWLQARGFEAVRQPMDVDTEIGAIAQGVASRQAELPPVLRVLPRPPDAVSPALASKAAAPPESVLSRFVPRFLRPKSLS